MMRSLKPFLTWAAICTATTVPFALACDPAASDDERVLELIDDAIGLENDAIGVICDCWEELGENSRNDCLDDQILPSQRRCIEDSYLRESAASKLHLECLVPLMGELNTCLDAKLECQDADPTDACFEDFDLGLRDCVVLPNSVRRGLEDCYGSGGINAADGGSAPDGNTTADDGATGGEAPMGTTSGSGGDEGPPPPPDEGTGGGGVGECSGDVYACADEMCIPADWECDDYEDCAGGEDESNCGGTPDPNDEGTATSGITCDRNTFECNDGSCIPAEWVCDEYDDCAGAEDELNCGPMGDTGGEESGGGGEESGGGGEESGGGDGPLPPG
ncbi:MAG: LDL receptor domain-containing protein [Myxococcota bacterium]